MFKLGVVGFGARAEGMLVNFNTFQMGVQLRAVCDIDIESTKSRIENALFDLQKVHFYTDIDDMMCHEQLDGLFIGTNCDSHASLIVKALKYSVPLLIEKPVAICDEGISAIQAAYASFKPQTLVSFPLRVSTLCTLVKEIIDRGDIGQITHIEAINNVSYGRVYYKNWYRNDKITGGLFLQKSTHDLDYINFLLGAKPVQICAMDSKVIFKGNHPAGLKCSDCDEYQTCPESPFILRHHQFEPNEKHEGCSFALDTGNQDSGTVLVRYDNGVHAVYTQNFIARKSAAKRGAIIIGYKGTVEFDWVTGLIQVHSHRLPRRDTITVENNHLFHYGGDKVLCENFVQIMNGTGVSKASLSDGLLSGRMCIAAEKSARTSQFIQI